MNLSEMTGLNRLNTRQHSSLKLQLKLAYLFFSSLTIVSKALYNFR